MAVARARTASSPSTSGHAKGVPDLRGFARRRTFISHRKTDCGGGMDRLRRRRRGTGFLLDRNIKVLEGREVVLCSKIGF